MKLFPYQEEGVKFLAERHRALLFDAPGVGKTIQAIAAMDRCGEPYFNVVCPASVVMQWNRECRKHAKSNWPGKAASYDFVRKNGIPGERGVLTIDESHYLKNRKAARTKKIFGTKVAGSNGELATQSRIWCLSGTPSPKNPGDLYPVMRAVVPGSLVKRNGELFDYWGFMNRFCVMRNNGFGMEVVKGKNLEELADRLAPYMLRRTKEQVREQWKEPIRTILYLDDAKAAAELRKAERSEKGQLIAEVLENRGVEGLKDIEAHVASLRRITGMCKVHATVAWLKDQFDDGLEKIVVFAYHRDVISALKDALSKDGIHSQVFWGGMSDVAKDEAVKRFQSASECKVFLGQLNASGTGLDGLQKVCGDVVFIERSWIEDENQQAIDRLDRIGQTRNVLARFVTLEGSLDEAITERAEQRAADNETLFG